MFSEKTILLTGATHGIGNYIARHLCNNNAKLILVSRNIHELILLNNDIDKNNNNLYFALDVSDSIAVENLFNRLEKQNIILDAIINCAGTFGTIGTIYDVSPNEFNESFKTNLVGPYNTIFYGLKLINKKIRSKIINFSGGGATNPFPNYSSYSCSKISLVKLTENLAEELKDIDVNIIAPGFIKTRLALQTINAGKKAGNFLYKTLDMLKDGGVDISHTLDLISFLLSKESDLITGKIISAPWDNWKSPNFQKKLKSDKNFCTLRRIDEKNFIQLNFNK